MNLPKFSKDKDIRSKEPVYLSVFNRNRLVHIVDADMSSCGGITALFRLEGFLTGFSTSLTHLEDELEKRWPDIFIYNLSFGIDVLRQIKSTRRGTPIFATIDEPDINLAVEAMRTGVIDVAAKPIEPDAFMTKVRDALRRDVHVSAARDGLRKVEIRGFHQLTPREREVLQHLVEGKSNKEVGLDLGISPRTVEVHRARLMEKLCARNTADLLRIVLTS
ncbi:response regulator transcription factor [Pelagibacterium lentulum]|uniref:DNA-binding response regulator n=1 Tax=Pelagibacterium lentulum TaxID=2029865 RepID=A0A916VXQ3_9HYPH|nr:LuxR C-terminal-related transcriptional regulator [Pelagibacterium lentulum]GGA51436.1 hypothetical protein GCM10011499_21850 [Pelagibacterium lentulum]